MITTHLCNQVTSILKTIKNITPSLVSLHRKDKCAQNGQSAVYKRGIKNRKFPDLFFFASRKLPFISRNVRRSRSMYVRMYKMGSGRCRFQRHEGEKVSKTGKRGKEGIVVRVEELDEATEIRVRMRVRVGRGQSGDKTEIG